MRRPDPREVRSRTTPFEAALGVLAVALAATGCGPDGSDVRSGEAAGSRAEALATPGVPTGSLTIARPQDVRDLNPLRQANNATSEVTYQIHEGLFTLSPDQEIVGMLATSWELLDDGLTYRLHLREGVTFHSGAPFDAEAVRWNFEKQLKTEPLAIGAGLVPPHEEITVVDAHPVDITLEEPNGVFVQVLAAPLLMMVDPARYEALGERYATDPSGALGFEPTARAFDLEEAGRLLDAAGWVPNGEYREKNGRRLSVTVHAPGSFPGEIESMLVVQAQWQRVGIELIIEQIESGAAAYASSRAATEAFGQVAAIELAPHGILLNTISPGLIDTQPKPLPPGMAAALSRRIPTLPLARPGQPEEVANLVSGWPRRSRAT